MSIQHKFLEHDFGNGFQTHNAILDVTPYQPEVMIIGTFNPQTPNANFADFFYGRNYFWPAFKNMLEFNNVELKNTRMPKRGKPKTALNPSLDELKVMCEKLKLTFADLISVVLHQNAKFDLLNNDNVIFNGQTFNLIQDGKKEEVLGLSQLDILNQIGWNSKFITDYLLKHATINTVYFTRQPIGVWKREWDKIKNYDYNRNIQFGNIFTPSGQGSPVLNSMQRLINHWIHTPVSNFVGLNHDWLIKNGVNLDNF